MVPPSNEIKPQLGAVRESAWLTFAELLENPFPGVPLLGVRVSLDGELSHYNFELLTFLYNLADSLDAQTNGETRLEKLVAGVFSGELFSYEEVVEQQKTYISALKRLAEEPQDDKKIVFACPIYGALPIAEQLRETFPDSVFTCNIGGSLGTTTGFAEVKGDLVSQLLDENNTVIVVDDVGDSFMTAAQLAMKRRGRRLGFKEEKDYQEDKYGELIKSIQDLREEREDLRKKGGSLRRIEEINKQLAEEYPLLVPLFQEENVVIATLYSKNKPVFDTLTSLTEEQANEERDQWIKMQRQFLAGVCTEIDESHWVVGAQGDWPYPLLDIKVSGAEILERIQDLNCYSLLTIMGLGELSVRVGAGIKSLKVFNPEKKEDLLQALAGVIGEWIKVQTYAV